MFENDACFKILKSWEEDNNQLDEDPVMGEEVEVNVCGGEENGDEVRGFEGEGCVTEMFRRREDSGDHVKLFEGEENVTEVRVNEGDVFGDLNMPPVIAGGDSIEFTLEPDGTGDWRKGYLRFIGSEIGS